MKSHDRDSEKPVLPAAALKPERSLDDSSVSRRDLKETVDLVPGNAAESLPGGAPALPRQFGRYEVRALLGQGGFGAVYLGYDRSLEREVAIKVPQFIQPGAEGSQAFFQEARQLAQLKHPGIVMVFDMGVDHGICFIVTDYLKGQNLSSWLKDHQPSWQETVRIVAAIADALDHAHAQRTVHRDLKPANVILVDDVNPVLVDFGLALSDVPSRHSQRGIVSGTPVFMSPEQARGEGHRIDGRTDIYSLGVILYLMLTRRLPFSAGDMHELLREIQEDDPQPPRQLIKTLPRELESVCLKALAKPLKDRYTTAGDMADELRRLLSPSAPPLSETPSRPPAADMPAKQQHPTPPSSRSSERRAREAERRRITVLQCGCEWFRSEAILEALDPEEQHDLLLEFQKLGQDVAARFRGTIIKATDHGVQVCFGFPVAYEDAALCAVRAGLELIARMTEFNAGLKRTREINLSANVAIHSDLAVVQQKSQAGESLSIVGSILSVVDQLGSLAEPNSVLLSEDTHRLVKGFFECDSQGVQRLRGITTEKQLYRVVKERSLGSRVDVAEPTGLTPLIGRDREVGLLQERWEQACEGVGQIVLLSGEAGIGKSRLVHGLKEFVVGQNSGLGDPIIEWRSSAHHQNSSLYPAIECFERILGLTRQHTAAQKLERLVKHLERFHLDGAEQIALLASLLSIPLDGRHPALNLNPQRLKEKTLDLLLEWLRENTRQQPMLFIVEDLHWVDPTTLEFLETLIDEATRERLLLLFTFRPEFESPWRTKSHLNQVSLSRLTRRQIGEMMHLRSGVQNIPQQIIDQIAERTDGVPLFIEEFTAMVLASGKVREVNGALEISESFPLHEIPASLQDLLMARLDRMASNIEVVQIASTLGREFSYELLQAVTTLDESELQKELAKLVEAELLFRRGRQPHTHYQFKHALIQDAAYQSLLKKKRLQFHQQIGQVLEAKFPETCEGQPEVLAHHFTEAHVPVKAVEYWARAGERALKRCAHQEAIRHLTRGLELLKTLPESAERHHQQIKLHISLGVPLQATRGYSAPEVEANYAEAHKLCLQIGLTAQLFPVLYGLFRYYTLQAKYAKAIELGEQLRSLAEQAGDAGYLVAAHRALGATNFYRGESKRSLEHLQKVIAVEPTVEVRTESYRYDVVDLWITARSYLAWVLWLRGFPEQALLQSRQAIDIAKGLDHPFSLTLAYSFASWLHQFRREVDAAAEASDKALRLSAERGYAFWIGWAQIKRGWVFAQRGQPERAVTELVNGLKAWRAQGSQLGSSYYLTLLAEVNGNLARFDDAFQALTDAQRFVDLHGEGFWQPEIHRIHGELLLRCNADAAAEAETCFQHSLTVARLQEAKSLELRAATSLAHLWRLQGKKQEAHEMLATIVGWFSEGQGTHDLVQAKTLLES